MPEASHNRPRRVVRVTIILVLIAAGLIALKILLTGDPHQILVNRYGAHIERFDNMLEVSLESPRIKNLSDVAPLLTKLGKVASLDVSLCPALENLSGIELLPNLETFSAAGCADLSSIDTEHPRFHQETQVPSTSKTHSADDVAIYAGGPWAHLFQKTYEQNFIYHVMNHAADLDRRRQLPWWKR